MRPARIVLAAIAVGAAGTLALPLPAGAAQGTLTVNGDTYADPSGCYEVTDAYTRIVNATDEAAFAIAGPACHGPVIAVVGSGVTSLYVEGVDSVLIR